MAVEKWITVSIILFFWEKCQVIHNLFNPLIPQFILSPTRPQGNRKKMGIKTLYEGFSFLIMMSILFLSSSLCSMSAVILFTPCMMVV